MKKAKLAVTLIVLFVLLLSVLNCFYIVEEDEYACVVRFSKIISTTSAAGLHMKIPFVDSIKAFPKAIMLYDIPPSEVLTSDKKNMTVDSYILWKIQDPLLFFSTLSNISVAEERLNAITYNVLKNVMGTLQQSAIISQEGVSARNDIYENITKEVAAMCTTYGINVVDVKVKRLDLPEDNEQAVYNRMISDRTQIAEKYTADGEYEASIIRNNVDKQVKITVSNAQAEAAKIEAEGESEFMQKLAKAYDTPDKREFFEFMKALSTLKASLSGGEKTVILGRDSVLGKLLIGP